MSKFFKSLLLLLSAGLFSATGWAADPDVTGVIPWARYELNGSDANTGDGGKTWNNGGGFSYTVTGARGDAATNVSATGSRWTSQGNSGVLSSGLTVSVLATEGTTFAGGTDNNGHIFSMAQKNQGGSPRWWIRNSSSGTVKLQGLFTTALDVTNSVEPTGFHHYVVRISADRTKVDVFVDGIKIDTSALTVATNLDDTIYGYQLNGRWGGGTGPNATLDDVRIYDEALTDAQIAKLNVTLSKYAAIGKCRDLGIAIPENTQVTLTATPSEVTLADGALAISAPVKTANASDSESITWKVRVDERHLDLVANKAFADGTYTLTATATEETLVLAEFSSEEAPVLAKAVTVAETTSFGATSDQEIDRTIDGKKVIVAKVTEMTADEYAASIFGVHSQTQGDKTAVQRDVYLNVTGGKYNYIVGGSENHWQGNHATPLQGNIFLEMGSGVTANNVIGVAHKGGDGSNARGEYQTLTGNATTIVHGSVRGWIVGGVTTAHNCIPLITGDTLVRVTSVQTNNEGGMNDNGLAANDTDRILGGSAKIASNGSNGAKQTGNASVEIILPNESEGNFVKEIAGGSYASGSNSYAITGDTSVLIDAPQTVTFTKPIYGGSITDGAQAPISGTASVTINGGTFTSTINAGSYGDNAKAAGVSTLTINGGDLSAATVQPGAVTSSKLVINNNVTIGTLQAFNEYEVVDDAVLTVNTANLSGVTAPMTVASGTGTVTIGKNRNVTYAGFGSGVVAVTVTADEIVNTTLQLPVTTAVTSAPEVARFALTSETGATITPTEIALADNMLTITLPSMYLTVTESNSWSEAVGEATGAVLVVGGATAENAVEITIDAEVADAITEISITGYVKMATAGGVTFPANKVKIADGAHLELTAPSQDGEWSISEGATLTLIGGEDESATTTLSNEVTVATGGTLETKGYLTLNNEANKVNAGGILKVLTGCTVLNSGENGNGLCGRIEIAHGATLKSTRADGLHYNGSPEVHVYGTLDMGSYRWTVGTNNKFYIYGGATIKGEGDSHGALDFLAGTHTVTIPSANNQGTEIEIPAVLRLRASDTLVKFDAQLVNSTIKLTGTVKDAGALQKVGTGNSHLELSGANKTYSGATTVSNGYLDLVGGTTLATSSIVVNSGTALQFLADANNTATTYSMPITNNARIDKSGAHTVTLEGVISGAGTLNAKEGELVLTAANTRGAGAVTIEAGATLDVSGETARLYNNSGHFNATLTVRGSLRVRDWTYGQCLGNLAHNYGRLQLDGGRIIVTTDVESERSFTVTGNGGTIEVEAGKTYTYNGSGETDAWLVFNDGAVLTIDGSGTFVANGVSGSAANIGAISVASGATFKRGTNAGSVASLTFADGATLNVEDGAVTVNGAVNLPDALKVVLPNGTLPTAETPVTLLATTAFAGDEGYADVALTVNGAATEDYILNKTATELTLVPAPDWEDVASVTATSDVNSWSALLSKMKANRQRFEEGVAPTLTIDFGSEGGEAGTFTFNNEEAITLTSITVTGTNGGTIVMADGAEIAYGTLVLNTTVAADAAFYAENTGAIEGTGKLCLASGELTFSGANTYTGGTDIATGATLTITNADAIGTGAITGAGTLACDGFMPTNKTGLTDAENWTGTLALVSTPEQTDIAFNSLGNASSTVRLQDYTGGLSTHTNTGTDSTIPVNLEIKGTNTINRPTGGAVPIFQGKITGDSTSTIDFQTNTNTNYLFTGDFSEFKGTLNLSGTGPKVAIGPKDWTTWSQFNKLNEHQGKITIFTDVVVNGTFIAVNGVMVGGSGTTPTLSGNGTIDSALTLTANATIDASATLLTVTGAVTLPDALTVKIAAAPAVGTVVPLLNAANVTIPEGMTIAVMVGDTPAEGTYQLIKTPTALLLENVPAEDVTIEGSNIAAAQSYPSNQQGNYDTYGVQVDLDGSTPYAPGWVSGVYYPLASFAVVSDATGRVAVGTCVQVVDVDNPSNVVATSAPFQNENMESVSVVCSDVTKEYYRYTFKFEAPVYVDAAKTYQFRFVNGEGAAVACKLRALHTSADQSYCNWLNNQYEVINSGAVTPRYMPYVVLTAERIVDNSPILNGGDETLEVATVPEKIRLNTATFGYGTHTVLQYTGDGTPDWTQMTVDLPAGAEVIIDDVNKTWGFAIKTLNVLTVGDSITAGLVYYNNSNANWHVPGGYRLPLYKYLTRAGYSVKYLGSSDVFGTSSIGGGNANEANPSPSLGDNDHHEGHSGITLVTMLERFNNTNVQNEIASQGTPDVITLHLGTNDIMGVNDNTTDDAISADAEKVLTRMTNLLNRLQELYPNTKILVAKIIARSGNKNKVVTEFNKKLNTFFESNQEENLILVDLDINSVSYGLLRYDGLHPSTEGYTQMARGWFNAIEAEFDPFGDSMEAPTPATSTPMEDVTESDRTVDTVGMAGVLKAAEWTTFTDFETGYLSQFGYMLDSERPWQLDVRGENVPTVADGVLSLNGAPITVNPVDGRLGTTKSTYTIVMKVSDLVANDVIFTDSSVRNDDWPENVNTNHKGTTNADLGKLTVVDADTLQWTYNGLENGPTIDLTGVNLTDSTPDVIAITVTCNQCKVAVNGGAAVTVSQGSASESYRGSWSIGALSTADTGSSMKLYRLSFYEGAAEVTMPATEYVIPVGTYDTWSEAVAGLNITDTTLPVTINFTAADQTFTFNNADAVELTQVIVAGTAGGKLAKSETPVAVTTADLDVTTSVKMEDDAMALTGDVNVAADCVLTYNVGDGMTVNATHTGSGSIAVTNAGVYNGGMLEITKTCSVNVAVNASASLVVNVDPAFNGDNFTKALADNVTVSGAGAVVLQQGIAYANFDVAGVDVVGTYYLGIGGTAQNPVGSFTPDALYVGEDAALKVRAYRDYSLTVNAVYVEGVIEKDGGNVTPTMTVTADGGVTSRTGNGNIDLTLILEEGVLLEGATGLTVQNLQLPNTLKIAESALPSAETPVVLFKTTAFADAQGRVEGVTLMVNDQPTEDYLLYKTAAALELRPLMEVTEATASGEVDRWSEVLNQLSAEGKRLATSGATLIINFGDADGEAVPGTFTFDLDDESVLTLAAVQIQGTNGGTIQKSGTANVTATATAVNTNVEIAANAMLLGETTLANGCTLTVNDSNALGNATNFSAGEGSTVKLVDVDKSTLNLANLTNAAGTSNLILNNVKAYIYDCKINTLTLEGNFQMNDGNSVYPLKHQCITINTLTGDGEFLSPTKNLYQAFNIKNVENYTGSLDLTANNFARTVFFFGDAPQRFTDAASNANTADDDQEYFKDDYGTVYVAGQTTLVTDVTSSWHLRKLVVEDGASFQIKGWATIATSCSGAVSVENGGVLDLRALNDLSGINATVKAGGRILVKSGATVPDTIVFETDAILGICPASVDDIGSATLTVTAEGTAKTTATKKGYKTDGVTELGNWTDKGAQDNTLSFGYDPIFDGELCWWAYEFDNEVNTSDESNLGPISTGRDKTRMTFDRRGDSNRHCEGNEYVVTSEENEEPVTKAIRLASGAYRSATWPEAGFTAAAYGRLTPNYNRVLFAFGQTNSKNPTIALATGASANAVQLVLIAGREDTTTPWQPDVDTPYASPITVLAETTVPNATTEDHLFAFSYELKDTDDNGTKDATEIVFYVDGDKYQPYKVNKVLTIGGGFQMGTTFGGVPDQYLTRMNEDDVAATIEFLRVYDDVLPEATFTAMANAYPYISKVGRATRTIVAGADTTWHEAGEWSQVRVVDGVAQEAVPQDKPDFGTIAEPEIGTQVFLNVDGENTLYLNEFYSTTTDPESGETTTDGNSKLYYERLEINGVAGGDEDSLTMWAGRLNPAIEEEDPLKNSQSAVLTVLGYTKINTNVTFAHNVAYLSGPVAVAEGKYLHFDFSGFDVMKVPSMPVTYRLTGFLDEETRTRVTSTAPAEPVNARSIDLGYKTDVNQYTFKVDRYPVTAYFTEDEMAGGNSTEVNFNNLNYVWQGNDLGKTMNWEAEAVDPQGNHIIENTLAKFVSLDSETQQEKIVTVTLATNDAEPITLTLAESALSKETAPDVVEPMLGAEQLIVGNNVIVDYTGDDAGELAPYVKEAVGMVKAKAMTATTWRGNLTLDNGEETVAIAGTNTISGKLVLGKSITLATGTTISAKDADFTAVEAITVDYEEAVAAGTYKVVGLEAGHTAKSLIGCVVTAVKDDTSTVEWTEAEGTLVVVRADGLYVVARPDVKAGETVIATNDGLTLPLARRAAELSATSVSLTGVVNMAGDPVDAPVADAAEVFTNVAFDMNETVVDGVVTAKLKYDFGVSDIAVVTIGGTQYVVAELIVSNNTKLDQNTAGYADGTTIDVSVKVGDAAQDVTVEAAADMTGATVAPAAELPASTRYIRFQMPTGNGTFEIKARASKSALP